MDLFMVYAYFAIALMLTLVVKAYLNHRKTFCMPPAPLRLPIIGNAYLMRGMQVHHLFHQISKQYGSIITFWVGKSPVIVVNEIDAAKEALVKQAKIFAGRPQRYIGGLYSRGFKGVIIADYGESWKKSRQLAHHALRFNSTELMRTQEIIANECELLVSSIGKKTSELIDISEDISLSVMNIICTMCFGQRYALDDPEFLSIVEANSWFFKIAMISSLIEAFPILKYVPWINLNLIEDFVKIRDEILEKKFQEHEQSFDKNNIRDIMDYLIHCAKEATEEDTSNEGYLGRDNQIMLVADLFIAGADTIATTLLWTLLYMSVWPEKQKKLHQEIDRIIGQRNPLISDKPKMHFLQATIHEALRLSSLTPLGVPRKATESTKLGGFDIPKGTTVMFNLYSMNHDESTWNNPHEFNPERFLNENGLFYPSRVDFIPFSAGKRVCLGESIAKMELFLILAYLFKNFEFRADGEIDLEGVTGSVLKPKPFKIRIFNHEYVN